MNDANASTNIHMSGFFRVITNRAKFRLFMLRRLPAAFFSGLKVVTAGPLSCTVSVPFKWFTQNPFRSTYFACLGMAAEMSTGILAMAHVYGRKPSVSMLITGCEATFHKKATGVTTFTCNDGAGIGEAIAKGVETGEAQVFTAHSVGKGASGEHVADFRFTWSFKVK